MICPRCKGRGYTRHEAPVFKAKPKPRTIKQGSGCTKCYGTGRLDEAGQARAAA